MEINRLKSENAGFDVTKRTLENQNRELASKLEILTNELNRLNQINIELTSKLSSSATLYARYDRITEAYVLQVLLTEVLSKRVAEL